jgi:hypothetical protein
MYSGITAFSGSRPAGKTQANPAGKNPILLKLRI